MILFVVQRVANCFCLFFKAEQVAYCGCFGFFAEKKLSAVTENSMQREPKR